MTASALRCRSALTGKVAGSVPSEGRSQAGGPQIRSAGGDGGGNGSKNDIETDASWGGAVEVQKDPGVRPTLSLARGRLGRSPIAAAVIPDCEYLRSRTDQGEEQPGMRQARLVIPALIVVAIASTACSNVTGSLVGYTVGPAGHEMVLKASPGQKVQSALPSSGNGVLPHATQFSYRLALPGGGVASIEIMVSPTAVLEAHARWIINDDFNNIPEHRTTWHGLPADAGVIPCTTPAGPCPGYQGGFTIFVGRTLYNVFVTSASSSIANEVVRSVEIS
jgi:hypothetical protein